MNKDESVALLLKGPHRWAEWAASMLAEKERLKSIGAWNPVGDGAASAWEVQASVDFVGHQFVHDVSFDGLEFPGVANFRDSKFAVQASFKKTRFLGPTNFYRAALKGSARFDGAVFEGIADFRKAVFLRGVEFSGAEFLQNASFEEVEIERDGNFDNCHLASESSFSKAKFNGDVTFLGTKFGGSAVFFGARFSGSSEFSNVHFLQEARFTRAEFSHTVDFDCTRFSGIASFSLSRFSENAHFAGSDFCGICQFSHAKFLSTARFSNVIFHNQADFDLASFQGYADFSHSSFLQSATFVAIRGESYFTLEESVFKDVPNFQQAHFSEAPRLDVARIASPNKQKDKQDLSYRWRALKRLAVQAHDHEREQLFFAAEIKSLRGIQDRPLPSLVSVFRSGEPLWPGGARYWAGLAYQVFSDFGRSIIRPILWWLLALACAAIYYLSQHFDSVQAKYSTSLLLWIHHIVRRSLALYATVGIPVSQNATPETQCVAGAGDPWGAALYLAIHNGSLVASLGGSEKLKQAYRCLYGEAEGAPIIPYEIVYGGLLQTVISAVLVFLLILAIRNHFRIK